MLPTCPYFDDPRPSDILPLLRPVRNKYCDFPCIPGYRGNVKCLHADDK